MAELRRYRTVVSDSALWAGFRFRAGDVVISTPPKCGTTWMQMLCALLVFDTAGLPRPLTEISPWLDATTYDTAAILAGLEAQQHRRFVKTHTPLDGLPFEAGVTYLCVGRDPRDAMLSFEHATANLDPEAIALGGLGPQVGAPPAEDPHERFREWADAEFTPESASFGVSLANLVHHVRTFREHRESPQTALFHYVDLKADLPGQLRQLAAALSIDTTQQRLDELAAAATFDRMRNRADELAPGVDAKLWRSNKDFFRSGTSGQWRELLDPAAVDHYHRRVAGLAPSDLAEWLHKGWSGTR
ncbi:sulfotransferase domain-containing protein [Amycolatopsis sp. A133]|uniref:sulfotransferase domain-containing protein n=1 Tax=Amycolatopsis sp. A133 TaxID=3064472 RepID=UPI0027F2D56B|nr:sulfotransferase domain-containing protein [Amycolatopsis sp. A133]MDQ7807298.1 sulfotransferase domain-containing protein [Amycolatopsis sp. A133]